MSEQMKPWTQATDYAMLERIKFLGLPQVKETFFLSLQGTPSETRIKTRGILAWFHKAILETTSSKGLLSDSTELVEVIPKGKDRMRKGKEHLISSKPEMTPNG